MAKKASHLGAEIHWPPGDKRKRAIATVTPSDSSWLTMCGLAELWPDAVTALFPYQTTELATVFDKWKAEGWGQRGVHELTFHPDSPHMDLVKRWRAPAPNDEPGASSTARAPEGLQFLRCLDPVTLTVADLRRLRRLFPDVLTVDQPAPNVVTVGINYAIICDCMAARMDYLPAYTVQYAITWPGKWRALFTSMVPADTTLRAVAP